MEEKYWVKEIQKGNKRYLQDIAEKYYDDIYRFCCYQTGKPADSYDLAQETFLRFIKYIESYREKNLKGYLLTIACNVCKDYVHRNHSEVSFEDMQEIYNDTGQGVSHHERTEHVMVMLQAVSTLPVIQKEAIVLHYFYDMKYREIASITGAGVATVKSRIRQGTEKLKLILRKEDFYG